jgi:hypothetical protein
MPSQSVDHQVFKRPMTDAERKSADRVYKNAQKQARPAGFFALVFAAIGIFSGAANLDLSTSQGITATVILLVGLLASGLAFYTFRVRKTVSDVQNDGNVVVVRGPVTRHGGNMNASTMMVGPLSIAWNRKSVNPLQEGQFAEVACIPKLRSVVSINGAELDDPIRVMIPSDLEAKAPMGSPAYPAQPVNAGYLKTPAQSNAMSFCSMCGQPATGLAFCSNCGHKF